MSCAGVVCVPTLVMGLVNVRVSLSYTMDSPPSRYCPHMHHTRTRGERPEAGQECRAPVGPAAVGKTPCQGEPRKRDLSSHAQWGLGGWGADVAAHC